MERIASPPNPRLDAGDLRLVMALASAGTTARAASVLHLTQSAVSRALLAAENKLEVQLFERAPRGLRPTAAGQRLLDEASRLLVELADLERRLREPQSSPTRLRLVCECYTAYHWLPSTLESLRKSLPNLDVVLALEHTQDPLAALESGDIDVALVTSARVEGHDLEEHPLFEDEVVFVVSSSHRLAARAALTRADLREHVLLTSNASASEARWFSAQVFGRARPKLIYQYLPLTEAILDVARAGMGIAVLSEWVAAPHLGRGDLVARRLTTGPLQRPWRMVCRREVRAAAVRLLSALERSTPRARLPVR